MSRLLFFAELYDHKLSRLLFDLFPISDDVMGRHLGFPSMAFRITPSKTFLANQNAPFYHVTNLLANQNALFFFDQSEAAFQTVRYELIPLLTIQHFHSNPSVHNYYLHIYSLRHRKCGVRGYIHWLFV